MECPKCGKLREEEALECPSCGIIYFKYERMLKRREWESEPSEPGLLWRMPDADNPFYRVSRAVLMLGLAWLAWRCIASTIGPYSFAANSFLHLINTPFHEAGHMMFRPLGQFMSSLGGSLGQLLMPLVCLGAFLFKTKDAFGAAVALWWFGENFIDMAPYINDARSLSLQLLGGNTGHSSPYGFHDWEYILTESGLSRLDHALATGAHVLGSAIMIASLIWMALLLIRKNS